VTVRHNVIVIALGAALALVVPAAGQAATRTVGAGPPPAAGKALMKQLSSEVDAFFPNTVTVHVGDTVTFRPSGFHTVDLPPRGQGALPLITPSGKEVSGAVDSAGQPFWFDGQPLVGFNRALRSAQWGRSATYTGTQRVESGMPAANKPRPFRVRFSSPGTFRYFCNVHPNMDGVVRVVAAGSPVPSAAAHARAVAAQISSDRKIARTLQQVRTPPRVVHVGQAGPSGVERYALLPAKLQVKAGTAVRFEMTAASREVHTATSGPGPATRPTTYVGNLAKSFISSAPSPVAIYPSEPLGDIAGLTPALHGNGFWNSGALDVAKGTPLPASNAVRFTKPGTYDFYCLVHPFMHGVVVVR
jgi:plastocyanin